MHHANDLTFNLITPEDAAELLEFETIERAWFEQHIEARPEHFCTPEGVAQHIMAALNNAMVDLWEIISCRFIYCLNKPSGSFLIIDF